MIIKKVLACSQVVTKTIARSNALENTVKSPIPLPMDLSTRKTKGAKVDDVRKTRERLKECKAQIINGLSNQNKYTLNLTIDPSTAKNEFVCALKLKNDTHFDVDGTQKLTSNMFMNTEFSNSRFGSQITYRGYYKNSYGGTFFQTRSESLRPTIEFLNPKARPFAIAWAHEHIPETKDMIPNLLADIVLQVVVNRNNVAGLKEAVLKIINQPVSISFGEGKGIETEAKAKNITRLNVRYKVSPPKSTFFGKQQEGKLDVTLTCSYRDERTKKVVVQQTKVAAQKKAPRTRFRFLGRTVPPVKKPVPQTSEPEPTKEEKKKKVVKDSRGQRVNQRKIYLPQFERGPLETVTDSLDISFRGVELPVPEDSYTDPTTNTPKIAPVQIDTGLSNQQALRLVKEVLDTAVAPLDETVETNLRLKIDAMQKRQSELSQAAVTLLEKSERLLDILTPHNQQGRDSKIEGVLKLQNQNFDCKKQIYSLKYQGLEDAVRAIEILIYTHTEKTAKNQADQADQDKFEAELRILLEAAIKARDTEIESEQQNEFSAAYSPWTSVLMGLNRRLTHYSSLDIKKPSLELNVKKSKPEYIRTLDDEIDYSQFEKKANPEDRTSLFEEEEGGWGFGDLV